MYAKLSTVVFLAFAAFATAQDRQYNTQHSAKVDEQKKTIDAQLDGFQWDGDAVGAERALLNAQADRVNLALKNARQSLGAQAAEGNAAAQAGGDRVIAKESAPGQVQAQGAGERASARAANGRGMVGAGQETAAGQLQKDRAGVVRGGAISQGDHRGIMKNQMENGEKQANFVGDGQYRLDTGAASRRSFRADTKDDTNGRANEYALDANYQEQNAGVGDIVAKHDGNSRQYTYDVGRSGQMGDAKIVDNNADRSFNTWQCTAEKEGESVCRNDRGQTVGKVLVNRQGQAVATDKNGVVVGRGNVRKVNDQVYAVDLNQGFAKAQTKQIVQQDCYRDVAGSGEQTKKVIIENVKATPESSRNADGSSTFSWPSCFNVEADVTIPSGVDPTRLAFEYVSHILPLGNLQCQDSATCGRECYYCNMCEKQKLMDEPLYVSGNLCDLTASSKKQQLKMRMCPPEDAAKEALCTKFDRHLVGNDYYKYNGSFNTQFRVWQRPDETTLRKQFFDQIALPLGKTAIEAEYRAGRVLQGDITKPTDMELLNWFVRNKGQEQLMACKRVIVDYTLSSEKLPANAMFDAFVNLPQSDTKLFSDRPCDEWLAQQDKEYEHYKQLNDAQTAGDTSGLAGTITRLTSFLGGRRGGRRL
jgi:hypothetical protein